MRKSITQIGGFIVDFLIEETRKKCEKEFETYMVGFNRQIELARADERKKMIKEIEKLKNQHEDRCEKPHFLNLCIKCQTYNHILENLKKGEGAK